MTMRIPFGLDRLPRTLAVDSPLVPGVTVDSAPLRLNSEPLPAEAIAVAGPEHESRVEAMRAALQAECGVYAVVRQRFVDAYFNAVCAHIATHRDELAEGLRRFDGLYQPQDWLWSAPRPLPRAWLPAKAGRVMVDVAFWDGVQAIAVLLESGAVPEGVAAIRITPALQDGDKAALLHALPPMCREFWRGEVLPRSPFRRAAALGVIGVA